MRLEQIVLNPETLLRKLSFRHSNNSFDNPVINSHNKIGTFRVMTKSKAIFIFNPFSYPLLISANMKSPKIIVVIFFTFSLFFNLFNTYAQSDSAAKKSYFKVGASYLSNAVYSGRKDSSVVSYFTPSIGYHNKSGFYVDGTMSLLANSTDAGSVDEILLGAGYDFSINDNVDAGLYASKYFYSNNSYSVTSELQGSIGAYFNYNAGLISIGGGADALISTGTDLTVNGNLSHGFSLGGDNNTWNITPTAEVNAGTQAFYRAYFKNRKFGFTSSGSSGKGHNSGKGTSGNSKTVSFLKSNRFAILDYELSIPVTYDAKGWGLFATPTLALPVNPATYAVDGVAQTETLSTSIFVKVGAYFKF
jgi:hypothetical protein